MIDRLVQSALNTGWLSVESEGLIRQVVTIRGCTPAGQECLKTLAEALRSGKVKREAAKNQESYLLEIL